MNRQKVAKKAIAHYNKMHDNPSSEAKNFYIGGWLDGVQELYSLVKRMREAQKNFSNIRFIDNSSKSYKDAKKSRKQLESVVDEYLKKMEV